MKAPRQWITLDNFLEDSKKLTRLTALWYVTEVLAKLIAYNIRVKQKETKKAKKPG